MVKMAKPSQTMAAARTCRYPVAMALLAGLLGLATAAPSSAATIDRHHASWTARDGAPQMVITIAQTTDGWLWLGGATGLFRFDGVRFERYVPPGAPLPANGISILNALPSGALWIGYRFGGASVLDQGRLRHYDERDGLPAHSAVWGLEQDGGGRVWAATSAGMFRLERGRWLAADPAWLLPRTGYKTLLRDRQGILWAQGNEGVYSLAPGAARFVKSVPGTGTGVLFDVPDGSIWSWDGLHNRLNRLTPPLNGARPRRWNVGGDASSMLFDRAGDLWVGRQESLEYHTVGGIAATGPQRGLSGSGVAALFEDREGNIWASTSNGIDRFRGQRVAQVPLAHNPGTHALAADDDGGAWVGRYHIARPAPGFGTAPATALWPASPLAWRNVVTCSYRDPDGVLWTGGYGGLWRKRGDDMRPVALPPGVDGVVINSMARDRAGGLWVALAQRGLYLRTPDGVWERKDGVAGLPDETPRTMAHADAAGLWLGYPRGRLLQFQDGLWRRYGPGNGVGVGMVMALHLRGDHVWAGGENGLALRQGGKFIGVGGVDGQAFEGISGIVELDDGDLWLNAAAGLFRVPAAEIVRLRTTPGYRVRYERLDSLDGLEGSAPVLLPTPSLILAADRHLWLTTTTGVFRLDPAHGPPPRPAPPVLIRAVGAPGLARPALAGMDLAPGTRTLQVDYTALALAMPERVRFRYRLEGVDHAWQDAGPRRAAYYSNVGPGRYRFSVMAAGDGGSWSAQPATLDFSIAPAPTETWWFKGLCALALLTAAWLLYRWRTRLLVRRLAGRLEERIHERERIARELHDTLLQSVQGLILQVHAAAMRLPPPEPARALIEKALLHADDVLHEGRDRVRDLRGHDIGAQGLAEALLSAGEQVRPPDAPSPRLLVSGTPRALHPIVHEEVVAIAGEAIANAYRHAAAGRIEVRLHYGAAELRLDIADDGVGIAPEVLAAGGRPDHWGFAGMRERAARIEARLALRSLPGAGTEWRLTLAGGLAYQTVPRRFWFQ
jgi:signal transduction histidine kinase/ligand-binding sensor domain-containing protein